METSSGGVLYVPATVPSDNHSWTQFYSTQRPFIDTGTNSSLFDFYDYGSNVSTSVPHEPVIYLKDPMVVRCPHKFVTLFVPFIILYTALFILGILGNSSMIKILLQDKTSNNITSWFLISLAAADLLLILLCIPLEILQYFLWTPLISTPVCTLKSYFEQLSAVAAVLNLTAVSLERYLVIVYPMKSRSLCTITNCTRAICLVWFASLILSLPAAISQTIFGLTYSNETYNVTVYQCVTEDEYEVSFALYRLVILFLIPAFLIIFFYARVIKALWTSTRAMEIMTRVYRTKQDSKLDLGTARIQSGHFLQGSPSVSSNITFISTSSNRAVYRGRSTEDIRKARKQVIKMLVLVVILFLVCWGPKIIKGVVKEVQPVTVRVFTATEFNLQVIFNVLPFLHSVLSPAVFRAMSSSFGRDHRSCVTSAKCPAFCTGFCTHVKKQTAVSASGARSSSSEGNGHIVMACTPNVHGASCCHSHLHNPQPLLQRHSLCGHYYHQYLHGREREPRESSM